MIVPSGPVVDGKFSLGGIALFVGFGLGIFFLIKWLTKSEVVVTDSTTGTQTKIGEVKTSFANPFAKKATQTSTQTPATTTANA